MKDDLLTHVICTCKGRDLPTWQVGAPYIVDNIAAKNYRLYVPDEEVALFTRASPAPFSVFPESELLEKIRPLLAAAIPEEMSWRTGWYLQQFIKLAAARKAQRGETVLIWDADTVPLRPLHFVSSQGSLRYYRGDELHPPYTALIKKLFPIEPVNFSFIAQCLAFRAEWLHQMCQAIESGWGLPWHQAIIELIDFTEVSGFSEYETLGNFIAAHHSDEIEWCTAPWHRYGNMLVNGVGELTARRAARLAREYSFMSFEYWDVGKRPPCYQRMVVRLRTIAGRGKRRLKRLLSSL